MSAQCGPALTPPTKNVKGRERGDAGRCHGHRRKHHTATRSTRIFGVAGTKGDVRESVPVTNRETRRKRTPDTKCVTWLPPRTRWVHVAGGMQWRRDVRMRCTYPGGNIVGGANVAVRMRGLWGGPGGTGVGVGRHPKVVQQEPLDHVVLQQAVRHPICRVSARPPPPKEGCVTCGGTRNHNGREHCESVVSGCKCSSKRGKAGMRMAAWVWVWHSRDLLVVV